MHSEISAFAGHDRRWLVIAAIIIVAIVIGATVAGTNWIVIAGLLALPLLVLRPRDLCLGVYAFLLPFDSITKVGPGGQTLTLMAGAAVVAVMLGTALVRKDLQAPPRYAWCWALLVVWAGLTVLWAPEWELAATKLFTAVSLLLVYLVVVSANISRKELKTISLFAVGGATAAAIYVSLQFFAGAKFQGEMRGSLMSGSTAADPNYFAASLLLPLSLAVNLALSTRGWLSRLAWLAVAGTITFGIFVTMSRGAVVAIAVMILFYMTARRVSRGMTFAIVGVFVALIFFLPNNFVSRIESAGKSGGAGRTTVWSVGWLAFKHHGLVGAGLNNFPIVYRDFVGNVPLYGPDHNKAAHNIYLEVAVELGVIGLALLLTAFWSQLREAWRSRKTLSVKSGGDILPYEAACYSILVAAFFISVLWEKWFWLAWILLAVAVRIAKTQQPSEAGARVPESVVWPWEDVQVPSVSRTKSTGVTRSGRMYP
jgi:exopolysaccharide production protein ExoQ